MKGKCKVCKRLFTGCLFLTVILSVLFVLYNVKAYAAGDTNDKGYIEYSGINTATVKNREINAVYRPLDFKAEGTVMLLLPDPAHSSHLAGLNIKVNMKFKYGNSYREMFQVNKKIQQVPEGYTIEISGIDWSDFSMAVICVSTYNYLYIQQVYPSDAGEQITLISDPNCQSIELNVETANGSAFEPEVLNFAKSDGSGGFFSVGLLHQNEKIPCGDYSFQITGTDGSNSYLLFKQNVIISDNNHKVSFSRNDYAAFNINLDSSEYNTALDGFYAFPENSNLDSTYGGIIVHSGYNYLSKGQKYNFMLFVKAVFQDKNMVYTYEKENWNVNNNITFNIGTQLTSSIKFSNSIYGSGENTNDYNTAITDQYGNKITMVRENNIGKEGFIEFSRQNNVLATVSVGTDLGHLRGICMPDLNGVYDVSINIEDSIIPINATKSTVIISGSDKPFVVSSNPISGGVMVKTTEPIIIIYDRIIIPADGFNDISLKDANGNIVGITVKIIDNQITITPWVILKSNTKYILTVPENAIKSSGGTSAAGYMIEFTTPDSNGMTFKDPVLDRVVREILKKGPADFISQEDMEGINSLSYYGQSSDDQKIRDLSGLQYATNLNSLYLNFNKISDLSPISGLKNLITLNLSSNKINDISPIMECAQGGAFSGGSIDISHNYLDISDSSTVMNSINALKNRGINIVYSPQDFNPQGIIMLLLPDPAHSSHLAGLNIKVNMKYRYGNSYGPVYHMIKKIQQVPEGYTIEISGIDWSNFSMAVICVSTYNYLYIQQVYPSDAGEQITLISDSNCQSIELNVGTANGSEFEPEVLNFTKSDGSGGFFSVGLLYQNEKIPYGNYSFQITGTDGLNSYLLFKQNVIISDNNHKVSFSRNDYTAFNINLDSSDYNIALDGFYAFPENSNLDTTYGGIIVHSGNNYLSKGQKYNFRLYVKAVSRDKNMDYTYEKEYWNVNNYITFNIGTQLTSSIKFSNSIYRSGENTGDYDAAITDQYGNKITMVRDMNNSNYKEGVIEFSRQNNVLATVSVGTDLGHLHEICMPDLNGVYDVSINIKDSIIPINATKSTVTISRSDKPFVVSSNPINGAVKVKATEPIIIIYDRNIIYAGDGFNGISLKDANGNIVGITVKIIDKQITITPKVTLKSNTKYTLTVPENVIKSSSGTLAAGYMIEFTILNYGVLTGIDKQKPDDSDAEVMKDILIGSSAATEEQRNAADIDGDGKLTSADYVLLKRYIKNIISGLPVIK